MSQQPRQEYGDAAVAAFSVVNRVTMFAYSVVLGFGQGFQPVCGFNYGAGFYRRVRSAFWFSTAVGTCVCVIAAVAGAAAAPGVVRLFRDGDAAVTEIGARLLRAQCVSFPLLGFVTLSNMILQNVGATVRGSVLAAARQGLFFLPILYFGASYYGLGGLIWSQAVADALTFVIAIPFMIPLLGRLKRAGDSKENAPGACREAGEPRWERVTVLPDGDLAPCAAGENIAGAANDPAGPDGSGAAMQSFVEDAEPSAEDADRDSPSDFDGGDEN